MIPTRPQNPAETPNAAAAPLNQNELRSVTAVIAYVAYKQKANEAIVETILTTKFGVDSVQDLTAADYDEAIRFLVDLNLDEVMN